MENLEYYIALLAVIIVGVVLLKKITSCLFRIVVGIIILAILGWGLSVLGLLG
ncbi:hypothetical protein [Prevotella dentasini]|uniref:hypothetical protein n=1 Tax=Prevotella dentasini TaxID=589537 RepID=UPI000A8672EF|nr:hypothetical protein [Prevotella dentasini]